jgi:hypothetical protein
MRWRGLGLLFALCAVVPLVAAATSAPKAPSIAFGITPDEIGCYSHQPPVQVVASWRIVHPVTSATISGAVDDVGNRLPTISLSTERGKHGIVGARKLRMACSTNSETLVLTAVGPGGTTTSVATLNENRAD